MENKHRPSSFRSEFSTGNDLIISVASLLIEPIGAKRAQAFQIIPFDFYDKTGFLTGNVNFLRTDRGILMIADLECKIAEVCGLCLTTYDAAIDIHFEEEFWPDFDPLTEQKIETLEGYEGYEGFLIVEGQLDLGEAVRQYIEMTRPMSPRCNKDCVGLSASTLQNTSESVDLIDSRWSKLQTLRDSWR